MKNYIKFLNTDNLTDKQLNSNELYMQDYDQTTAALQLAEEILRTLEEDDLDYLDILDDLDEDFDDLDDLDYLDILDEDEPLPVVKEAVAESGDVADLENQFCCPAKYRDEEYKFYYRGEVWKILEELNHNLHLKEARKGEILAEDDEDDWDEDELGDEGAAALELLLSLYKELMPKEIFLEKVPARFEEAVNAIKELSKLVLESNSEAIIDVHPTRLTGTSLAVSFTAILLVFEDIPAFLHALAPATNFEVSTLVTGEMSFDVLFEGVFEPAKPFGKA